MTINAVFSRLFEDKTFINKNKTELWLKNIVDVEKRNKLENFVLLFKILRVEYVYVLKMLICDKIFLSTKNKDKINLNLLNIYIFTVTAPIIDDIPLMMCRYQF